MKLEEEERTRIELEKKALEEFKTKDIKVLDLELKKVLKKYSRRVRRKMIKLYEQYEKGQVLRPNENIDNKKLILENA